jgi:mono/diheme cytochrome c family protein
LAQRLEGLLIPVGPLQLPKIPKIEQIVLNEFDRGNFNTPLNRVDRCPSCHIGLEKAGFEEQPNPLKSHPHRELLGQHPLERFGCTPCHQGQGAAINSPEQAHGEVKFWEHPLLRGDTVDVGCIRCHADTRHLPPAKSITRGQILFEELGCHGCHLTEGYETLTKVGPSLRRLAAKTDPSWLVRWVKAPQAFRPRTRMPNFEFTDDQAIAVAAYLLDSSRAESDEWLAGHHPPPGVDPSDAALVARGRELVDSIGCRGCHGIGADESPALLGENKDVAPNLAAIAEKTNPRWLYHWIKNPSGYSHMARMPSLRLTDDEARAIASFLATLGRPERDEQLVARLDDADTIAAGKSLVRKYGCFGCHEVTGMENESRIGVELSTFASKPLEELFFGNHTDIPFTWDDWTYHKLKSPRTYATERIEQVMPNFQLSDADIRALRIFLKSRIDEDVPSAYLANTERSARIMRGRRLVARYNCVGCHVIEGDGGAIRARYEEQPTLAPPILTGQGAKVQPDWFFGFLKEPIPLRPWLKVRMPTFPLSDEDATALVEYFMAVDEVETPYFHVVAAQIPPEHVEAGRTLVSDDYFACFSCHQQGDRKPEGPEEGWAPDLSLARERLNPDWIIRWIRNPQAVQPGTKMPSFYPGGPDDVFEGDEERQIRALRDYIMLLGSPAQLASVAGTHNGAGEPENAPVAEDEQAEEE